MAPATLLDLPTEILLEICARLRKYYPKDGYWQDNHYCQLALSHTCKQLYHVLTPLVWKDVFIKGPQEFKYFARILSGPLEYGKFVRDFHFKFDEDIYSEREDWNWPNVDDLYAGASSIGIVDWTGVQESSPPYPELLQFILCRLPNLQRLALDLDSKSSTSFPKCSQNLDFLSKLEYVYIKGVECSSYYISRLHRLKQLKHIGIDVDFTTAPWPSNVTSTKTNVQSFCINITDPSRTATPNVDFLSQTFTGMNFYEGEELNAMLKSLKTQLTSLTVGISGYLFMRGDGNDEDHKRFELDFSDWHELKTLSFQSELFWPLQNGWEVRNQLYNSLPQQLEILAIHFNAYGDEWDNPPYRDGAFGVSSRSSLDLKEEDRIDQRIPVTRYAWVLNLLQSRVEEHNKLVPLFPKLKTIKLTDGHHNTDVMIVFDCKPSFRRRALPDEVDNEFRKRSIEIGLWNVSSPSFYLKSRIVVPEYWHV